MRALRFIPFLSLLAIFLFDGSTALGQTASGVAPEPKWEFRPLWMRNTSAASVVREANWAKGGKGGSVVGFADSIYFRRGATTATAYDTSATYRLADFSFAPVLGNTPSNAAATDTTNIPWIIIRVQQDTLQGAFSGTSGLDTIRIAAEVSYDGVNWFSTSGTPTRLFDTVYMTSGQDGRQSVTLIGVEATPGEDAALVSLTCHPGETTGGTRIINRGLCFTETYVRFIIGMDASGQFTALVGAWWK